MRKLEKWLMKHGTDWAVGEPTSGWALETLLWQAQRIKTLEKKSIRQHNFLCRLQSKTQEFVKDGA